MTPTFFAVKNLRDQAVVPCLPYEFKLTAPISEEIRLNKKARQEFYRNPATVHQFYCGIEGANPNQRVSKNNPPHKIHALIADLDLPLDTERIAEGIKKMKYPPAWVERSLAGNCRLVWTLARSLLVNDTDFAVFVLQRAREWLQMDTLPGIDAPAQSDPCRLYCNSGEWVATGAGPIAENAIQAFFVEAGSKFLFKNTGSIEIPLDVVEAECRKKFPLFSWPNVFELNSQGPSFWIADSASAMSAILKADGFFTFSSHATKPFYSFADILGLEFVKEFQANSVAMATKDVFWDGRLYWVFSETDERFVSLPKEALTTRLRVRARVSTKFGKDGLSMLDKCLDFIHEFGRVEGGAPILFRPVGLLEYNGTRFVNTTPKSKLVRPSGVSAEWNVNFPFIASVLDNLFDPVEPQRTAFLSWLTHFYQHAYAGNPSPGQCVVLCGGPGVGKTLVGTEVIGGLAGSFVDASKFLTGESSFNSSLFNSAIWCVNDEMGVGSDAANRTFTAHLKAYTANASFTVRKKFENDVTVSWSGRIVTSLNGDEVSLRTLPSLDGTIADKISLFKCVHSPRIIFPERHIIKENLVKELPHFAQFLLDYKIPQEWVGDSRYGVRSHHESSLMDRTHQSGRSAAFKEILIQYLGHWFAENPQAKEYKASVTQIVRGLHADFLNEAVLRSLKLETINRHLEAIAKEGVLIMRSESGPRKTRLWVIERFA